ncbi:MAG: tRNA uridine-5-carboxymethylaminomethyl(34) synthesis GTPase MnmE [Heliobacteriaceae bacterium]|jgi:tRNA modification GTPase|nr:tRNA uridine-5-carboxymethylaminomethyl(34) synthesis GTPase MnmE [Heliobacteriaceae bacterium]
MNILHEFDTITAIATPVGAGGIGVIRISGKESFEIINKIFSKKNPQHGMIAHGRIQDGDKIIDEVIVLPFRSPNSYTGEDVIEIHCHGGINVVRNILDLVLKNGARTAQRGEFTKRAFLNKKMDLSQAEAVADLIHAGTRNFAQQSAKNLSGVLSAKIKEIRTGIFEILLRITAGIDFPDDVKEPEYDVLINGFEKAIAQIDEVLAHAKASDIMRQGIKIVIAGKPNVGKSSLFNALLDMERAIVTDIAGTTRDVLKETLDRGTAITVFDTAGIREGDGKVEKIGIEYSKQSVMEADLILFVYDACTGMNDEDEAILDLIKNKERIIIANKTDKLKNKPADSQNLFLSAVTKEGLSNLKSKIKEFTDRFSPEDTEFITNSRQQDCLEKSKESLNQALLAAQMHELQDLISIDLKSALLFLDEITGEVITDEILNNIFENFCIGK